MSPLRTPRTRSSRSRGLLALALLFSCAGLIAVPALAGASPAPAAPPPRAPTLFVLRGSSRAGADDLAVQTRSVEWFTDRPERRAGTMTARMLVHNWQAWGFDHDPPNAALTGRHLDVVVELSKPSVRGGRLHFDVKPVRGKLPHGTLGGVSAFVDATSPEATRSSLQIVNNSQQMTSAYVFVTSPAEPQGMQSVAWLTTQLYPNATSSLNWDNSSQLMWTNQPIEPGIVLDPQQTLSIPPAGPGQSGVADLIQQGGGPSLIAGQGGGGTGPGSLAVVDQYQQFSDDLGLAMGLSGMPALAAATYPNAVTTFPVAGLTYWLATGYANQGQVIDANATTYQAAQLDFTPGVTSLTATLNADGTWTVRPS